MKTTRGPRELEGALHRADVEVPLGVERHLDRLEPVCPRRDAVHDERRVGREDRRRRGPVSRARESGEQDPDDSRPIPCREELLGLRARALGDARLELARAGIGVPLERRPGHRARHRVLRAPPAAVRRLVRVEPDADARRVGRHVRRELGELGAKQRGTSRARATNSNASQVIPAWHRRCSGSPEHGRSALKCTFKLEILAPPASCQRGPSATRKSRAAGVALVQRSRRAPLCGGGCGSSSSGFAAIRRSAGDNASPSGRVAGASSGGGGGLSRRGRRSRRPLAARDEGRKRLPVARGHG